MPFETPSEIDYLLSRVYRSALPLQRVMAGLANVAKALNANDLCLAHIAAVHLRIPALPDQAARQELEAADTLIKSVDWNPALHPRAGTPPNPGWFAPTDGAAGESSATQTAQNQPANQASDATLNNNGGSGYRQDPNESTNWPTLRNGLLMQRPKTKRQSGQRSKGILPTSAGKLLQTISTVS